MTTQEAYDAIRAHFETQRAIARDEQTGSCRYRTSDGLKCAVGCLIPDSVYDRIEARTQDRYENGTDDSEEFTVDDDGNLISSIEGSLVTALVVMEPELAELLNGDTEEGKRKFAFLRAAQRLHDDWSFDHNGKGDWLKFVNLLDVLALGANLKVKRPY